MQFFRITLFLCLFSLFFQIFTVSTLISELSTLMASPFDESPRFISALHAERYRAISECKIIEENAWILQPNELPEVTEVLKKHKLSYLNE